MATMAEISRLIRGLRRIGLTEEQIKAIYEYDWNEFNRTRAYYRHSLPLSEAMSLSVTDT